MVRKLPWETDGAPSAVTHPQKKKIKTSVPVSANDTSPVSDSGKGEDIQVTTPIKDEATLSNFGLSDEDLKYICMDDDFMKFASSLAKDYYEDTKADRERDRAHKREQRREEKDRVEEAKARDGRLGRLLEGGGLQYKQEGDEAVDSDTTFDEEEEDDEYNKKIILEEASVKVQSDTEVEEL